MCSQIAIEDAHSFVKEFFRVFGILRPELGKYVNIVGPISRTYYQSIDIIVTDEHGAEVDIESITFDEFQESIGVEYVLLCCIEVAVLMVERSHA